MIAEIRRRASAARHAYPYQVEGSRVVRVAGVDSVPYDFLLMLSLQRAPYRREGRFEDVNPAFEFLTREALIRHLGPRAEGVRFGWPARDDRPQDFPDAVEWLARRMGLEIGSLIDADDVDNDGGLDVAAWRRFGDGQPGHLAILAQCTVEMEFEDKAKDLEPMQWLAWIRFGRPPQSALVIPFVVPPNAKAWMRLAARADLLLDRMRLAELAEPPLLAGSPEYAKMQGFIASERQAVRDRLAEPVPEDRKADRRPRVGRRRKPVRPRRDRSERGPDDSRE